MLVGRHVEIRMLDALTQAAAGGAGGVLVLRGEAGIGKSTLLDHVRAGADGFRVVEASGSELETELPFAALHQLCRPLLGELDALPAPHRDALRVAFGLAEGHRELFRIGVALLELLATAAQARPVLCVVDDAQWLDDASVRAVSFLARRIAAEPVAMVLATRTGLDELPGVTLTGLADADARTLLAHTRATLDDAVRERVLAEARGNPLGLLELPGAGGFALPDTASVPHRIERSFADRAAALPDRTQMLLTLASADPTGDPTLLWRAAERLGLDPAAGEPAESSGLVELAVRIRFCHPLARSAVYRAAPTDRRQAAHRALAEVTDAATDPDRRAWHRGQTGTGPDEDVAAELERCAARARARGGVAAAAAFLDRAAALSLDPTRRTDRTLAAVAAHLDAGATDVATTLLTALEAGPLDEVEHARVELLRGQVASVRDGGLDGPMFMLRAARRLADRDPVWARACYLDAVETALVVGRASGIKDMTVEAARSAPAVPGPPDLLDALVRLTDSGHRGAVEIVRTVLAQGPPWVDRPALVGMLAVEFWDVDAHTAITDWLLATARESGSALGLRLALGMAACAAVHTGDLDAATAAIVEEEAIADAVGAPPLPYPRLHLAAIRGRPGELAAAVAAAGPGTGQTIVNIAWATAVQGNATGDYPGALAAAREAVRRGDLFVAGIALAEVVEAAVRCGDTAAATVAIEALTERTAAGGTDWGLGVGAYARALVTGEEKDYREAVDRLAVGPVGPYRARAHLLYGEWLRRQGSRRAARDRLRAAHELFTGMGMIAFADRAAAELRASGERARARSGDAAADALTVQEAHIARLVAGGATSKEVAGRLYISPRTVDAHLRNIFRKLGVTSRRQLRDRPGLR